MTFFLTFVALLAAFFVIVVALTALSIRLGLLPGVSFFQRPKLRDTQRVDIVFGEVVRGGSGTTAASNNVGIIKVGPQIVVLEEGGEASGRVRVATDARSYTLE